MSGPVFSPDGTHMWDGTAWVPAPSQEGVVPMKELSPRHVNRIAMETGVNPTQLAENAQYFDLNNDGVISPNEYHAASAAIKSVPDFAGLPLTEQQKAAQEAKRQSQKNPSGLPRRLAGLLLIGGGVYGFVFFGII